MLKKIRKAVHRTPFTPFSIELNSGEIISVPHPDHILAGRAHVAVEDDKGVINVLSAVHIARIRWQERETNA